MLYPSISTNNNNYFTTNTTSLFLLALFHHTLSSSNYSLLCQRVLLRFVPSAPTTKNLGQGFRSCHPRFKQSFEYYRHRNYNDGRTPTELDRSNSDGRQYYRRDRENTSRVLSMTFEGKTTLGGYYEGFTIFLILLNVLGFVVGTGFDEHYVPNAFKCSWCGCRFIKYKRAGDSVHHGNIHRGDIYRRLFQVSGHWRREAVLKDLRRLPYLFFSRLI